MTERRLDYVDNIRIFLTAVVILNHLSITYGAPGGWYYNEFETSELKLIPMAAMVIFAAFNQAYSMGFFFLISGFFSAKSLSEKGPQPFLFQRLIRLGIPILLFVYLVSPLLRFAFRKIAFNVPLTLANLLSIYQQIEFGYELGPMWFIILLLIFSLLLPVLQKNINRFTADTKLPGRSTILLFAIFLGALTFLVRISYPIGTVYQPLNLQTPHLVQYIFMFLAGVVANLAKWQKDLPLISIKFWLSLTIILIIALPVLFFLVGGNDGDVYTALGGFTWQSLVFSLWEQIFLISMIALILAFFFRYQNKNTGFTRELAASSYGTYIFHPLVIVIFTSSLQKFYIPPLFKFAILVLPTLVLCFLSASLLRRLPGLRAII